MSASTVSLTELVDLSLGTPEIVNYKGLRTLLLAIVDNLKLGDVQAELNEADKRELLAVKDAKEIHSRPPSSSPGLGSPATSSQTSVGEAFLHNLEQKVSKLENQMDALNALPSNENLMQRVRSGHQDTDASVGSQSPAHAAAPVSEMWQLMQVQKKAATNEEGVGKLMSMVEDMMRSVQDLKDQLNKYNNDITEMKNQLNKLNADNAQLKTDQDELKSNQEEMKSNQDELKSDQNNMNERLTKLESSTVNEEKVAELQKLLNDVNNRLNNLPPIEMIVTWPAMEDALKGIYKEPVPLSDGWIQTNPVTESTQQQTIPTSHSSAQTRTPSPPPRPPTSMSSRPGSAMSSMSVAQPTKEIQKILKEIGELTGKHDLLEERVKLLEELMEKKADLEEIRKLLGERQDVPEDLAKMLADLKAGLDSLHASKDKMDQLALWIEEESKLAPATQQDVDELREHLEQIHNQLADDIDRLIHGLPVGRAVSLSALEKLSNRLHDKLEKQSSNFRLKMNKYLGPLKSRVEHLDRKLDALSKMGAGEEKEKEQVPMEKAEEEEEEEEERVMTPQGTYDLDSESITEMQKLLLQMQAEIDKLNATCVHLVDEHNVKQKHIDALYTFVDRLQENKADKEHVTMEIDVKADKRMLENKVSRSQFQGTVDEISKNLNDVMSKLSGHKDAWEDAVGELKLGIENKLDRMELDPLKAYLDKRIKAVDAKVVKKEIDIPEDAAGFRRPLQKFNCISCDRPLDMTPQPPLASLPENKGLPGMRTGRPYTTFELEQIRAAQKKGKPGKNVQHYERALFEQELARQRKQDILAYIVHFDKEARPPSCFMRASQRFRIMFASVPETEYLHIENTPKEIPGELMKLKHTRQMTDYLKTKTPPSSSHYGDLPDYFVTTRSCGGSHTMTYPHRRIARTTNTQLAAIVPTEDMVPITRMETDIQGADGHVYRARVDPSELNKLPTISTIPKPAKSPVRTSSARGRRQPPFSATTERTSPRPLSARPETRPHSSRQSPRSSAQNFNPTTPANTLEINMNEPSENTGPVACEPPSGLDSNGFSPEKTSE